MTNERELMDEIARLKAQLLTVQNAAKTLAAAQNTELQHLRQNSAFDHKLRSEHASLLDRDALMTEQVATLTADNDRLSARVARLEAALKPFATRCGHYEPPNGDIADDFDMAHDCYATVGDLRAARRELEEGK